MTYHNHHQNRSQKAEKNDASFFVFPSLIPPCSPIYQKPKIDIQENDYNKSESIDFRYLDERIRSKIEDHISARKTLKCHHKNCQDEEYFSLFEYNKHCHNNHPKQPLHPELPLIKKLGLEPRGNPWE